MSQIIDEFLDKTLNKLPLTIFNDDASFFQCEKCDYVPLFVVSCNNGHIFCKECIVVLLNQKCPVDNQIIQSYSEYNQSLNRIISKQRVRCLYFSTQKTSSCNWTGKLMDLKQHLSHQCQYIVLNEISKFNKKLMKMQNEIHELSLIVKQQKKQNLKSIPKKSNRDINSINSITFLVYGFIRINSVFIMQIPDDIIQLIFRFLFIDPYSTVIMGVEMNDVDYNFSLKQLDWTKGIKIKSIIPCSFKALCFLTKSNDVYVLGCNNSGQLGFNHELDVSTPEKHPFFKKNRLKIKTVSSSTTSNFMFFICQNGSIYCCGENYDGQLGIDRSPNIDHDKYIVPKELTALKNINVKQIACGDYHSVFLTDKGNVYSCGFNEVNQLGYKSNNENQTTPRIIPNLVEINAITCGSESSLCLDINGCVYSFGLNFHGQLGISNSESFDNPNKVHQIKWFKDHNKYIIKISSGDFHVAAIDKFGRVFCWGRNAEGQVGNGKVLDSYRPVHVDTLHNVKIIDLQCGCNHSVALSEEYDVYCWGNNTEDFKNGACQRYPKKVYTIQQNSTFGGYKVICAASYNTLLMTSV